MTKYKIVYTITAEAPDDSVIADTSFSLRCLITKKFWSSRMVKNLKMKTEIENIDSGKIIKVVRL